MAECVLKKEPPLKRPCKTGLQNHIGNTSLNRCYMYSCLKALSLTRAFQELVTQSHTPTAEALKKLFEIFASGQEKVLSFFDDSLQGLITAIAKEHPDIQRSEQRDATEFFSWVVEALVGKNTSFFSCEEHSARDTKIEVDVCIPSIDLPVMYEDPVIRMKIAVSKEKRDLQDEFSGTVEEQPIDKAAIRNSERNKGKEQQVEQVLQHLGDSIRVVRCKRLPEKTPPCLIFQMNRPLEDMRIQAKSMSKKDLLAAVDPSLADMAEEDLRALIAQSPPKKVLIPVTIPKTLSAIRVTNGLSEYELAAVVIHSSAVEEAGHYYTLEPPATSTASWMRHDDERVVEMPAEEAIRRAENEGYLVFYNLKR